MDSRSLAIVFTPCIFPVEEEDFAGSKGSDSRTAKSLDVKVEVVQTLINNASKVGCAQYGCQMTQEVVGSYPAATDYSLTITCFSICSVSSIGGSTAVECTYRDRDIASSNTAGLILSSFFEHCL